MKRVSDIRPALLQKHNIRALILDADNTLSTHNNPKPADYVLEWLESMRDMGIALVIVSNNSRKRIHPFADSLRLPYTARALKPLPFGFRRTAAKLKLSPKNIAVVGDQIFTDILGGNLFGAPTILVEPIQMEDEAFFRLKRRLEAGVLRRYRKRRGRLYAG